ncbi:glycosyltransferase family 4 protein [Haloarcula argentinensis]|uniref:Uncharacterized protein n=1 Tax=Haloarcula argentinensis TaxID=43776 RepID=A0A830FHM2_HALAR|nr:glycosyltransferase family 4 protein [Haloarcula argentinensis]GGM23950.1 hypothetical protein GCM10009006_01560 [Haloarcula argentinensis]
MKLSIAFITPEFPPNNIGGAGISSKLIVDELRRNNIHVDVITFGEENPNTSLDITEDSCIPLPPLLRKNLSLVLSDIDEDRYDLIHVYAPGHSPAANAKFDIPVVTTVVNFSWVCLEPLMYLRDELPDYDIIQSYKYSKKRGDGLFERILTPCVELAMKKLMQRSRKLTVQTQSMKTILSKCGYDYKNIEIVPNITDSQFDISDNGKNKIIFVGRLSREKAPGDLISAYSMLPADIRRNWDLEIYGDGELKYPLKQKCKEKDLRNVYFKHEQYENLPRVYANSDLMIHPAKWPEPFSRTWLEAMQSSTAIISSSNPSAKDVLSGVAKFHQIGDPSHLAKVIENTILGGDITHMKEKGKRTAAKYEKSKIVSKYIHIYEDLIR